MGIFTTLKRLAGKERAASSEAYRKLVYVSAEDKPFDTGKATAIIEAADKTFDEFSAAVDGMADFQAADARLTELNVECGKELEAIRAKYREIRKRENLDERSDAKRDRNLTSQRRVARQGLQKTADPSIDVEIEQVIKRVREHDQKTRSLIQKKDLNFIRRAELKRDLAEKFLHVNQVRAMNAEITEYRQADSRTAGSHPEGCRR